MVFKLYIINLILLIQILPFHLKAAVPIQLDNEFQQFGVRNASLDIYEDKKHQWSLKEISSPLWKDSFHVKLGELPTNKNINSTYWLRFTLINKSTIEKLWVLEFFDHDINQIALYSPLSNGTFKQELSGNSLHFDQKKWKHKNIEFALNIPYEIPTTYYVKVNSLHENVIVPEIRSYDNFLSYALMEYFILGIFYGILVIMAMYNLWLYLALQKITYLYYVCYVLSIAVYTMCKNGLGFQLLWPDFPQFNMYGEELAIFCTMMFSVLFTKKFLHIEQLFPRLNKVANILLVIRASILLTGFMFYTPLASAEFLDLIPFAYTYGISLLVIFKAGRASIYFSIAYTLVFLTFVVSILENYGIIWSDIFTVYSINIGIVLDIVFLSISLADKMRTEINMREKMQSLLITEMKANEQLSQKVNKELEDKVTQRTMELNSANAKLQRQAEDITAMNLKLDLMNNELKKNVVEISQKRIIKPRVAFDEFLKVYSDAAACYRFIETLKSSTEFHCKKCFSNTFGKGKDIFDRRCTKCGYNESITANTLFHKIKFPIVKAFYMTHLIFTRKGITAEELSSLVDLRKETCSIFKRKVLDRMSSVDQKLQESWDVLVLNRYDKISENSEVHEEI